MCENRISDIIDVPAVGRRKRRFRHKIGSTKSIIESRYIMFFLMGINRQQKKLEFSQMMICSLCGQYGRYEVYRICTVLSLFFIPVLKWGKQYYVKTTCCNGMYTIDREVGRQIERKEITELRFEQLHLMPNQKRLRRCDVCGYQTEEDFSFCPSCGSPMK